jgi:hypothetical protein
MSMCRCDSCSKVIDSDQDLDCFVDYRGETVILCERCRDHDELLAEEADE